MAHVGQGVLQGLRSVHSGFARVAHADQGLQAIQAMGTGLGHVFDPGRNALRPAVPVQARGTQGLTLATVDHQAAAVVAGLRHLLQAVQQVGHGVALGYDADDAAHGALLLGISVLAGLASSTARV